MTSNPAYPAALRLLGHRDRSEADLAERLKRQGFGPEAIEPALQRCRELGYLDDRRLAQQLCEQLQAAGRAVGRRLTLELEKRGIPRSLAEEVAGEMAATPPQLLSGLLERKFPGYDDRHADPKQRRRVVNFFLRRGFPLADILETFRQSAGDRSNDQGDRGKT